jgi:hypothetical protein
LLSSIGSASGCAGKLGIELHEKIDALPYADSAPIVTAPTNAEPSDSDDEPLDASFAVYNAEVQVLAPTPSATSARRR